MSFFLRLLWDFVLGNLGGGLIWCRYNSLEHFADMCADPECMHSDLTSWLENKLTD